MSFFDYPLDNKVIFIQLEYSVINLNKSAMEAMHANDYDLATNLLQKSLHILKLSSPNEKIFKLKAVTFNNLGCLYKRAQDYPKALYFLKNALEAGKNLGDVSNRAGTLLNICAIKSVLNQHSEALSHALTAIQLLLPKKVENTSSLVVAYHSAGIEYQFLNLPLKAMKCFDLGFEIAAQKLGKNHPLTASLEQAMQDFHGYRGKSRIKSIESFINDKGEENYERIKFDTTPWSKKYKDISPIKEKKHYSFIKVSQGNEISGQRFLQKSRNRPNYDDFEKVHQESREEEKVSIRERLQMLIDKKLRLENEENEEKGFNFQEDYEFDDEKFRELVKTEKKSDKPSEKMNKSMKIERLPEVNVKATSRLSHLSQEEESKKSEKSEKLSEKNKKEPQKKFDISPVVNQEKKNKKLISQKLAAIKDKNFSFGLIDKSMDSSEKSSGQTLENIFLNNDKKSERKNIAAINYDSKESSGNDKEIDSDKNRINQSTERFHGKKLRKKYTIKDEMMIGNKFSEDLSADELKIELKENSDLQENILGKEKEIYDQFSNEIKEYLIQNVTKSKGIEKLQDSLKNLSVNIEKMEKFISENVSDSEKISEIFTEDNVEKNLTPEKSIENSENNSVKLSGKEIETENLYGSQNYSENEAIIENNLSVKSLEMSENKEGNEENLLSNNENTPKSSDSSSENLQNTVNINYERLNSLENSVNSFQNKLKILSENYNSMISSSNLEVLSEKSENDQNFSEKTQAAVLIQKNFKSWIFSSKYKKLKSNVAKIQNFWRNFKYQKYLAKIANIKIDFSQQCQENFFDTEIQKKDEENQADIKLIPNNSIVSQNCAFFKPKLKRKKFISTIIAIQALVRGFLQRQKKKKIVKKIIKLQSTMRMHQIRKIYESVLQAIIFIQQEFRKYRLKKLSLKSDRYSKQ